MREGFALQFATLFKLAVAKIVHFRQSEIHQLKRSLFMFCSVN